MEELQQHWWLPWSYFSEVLNCHWKKKKTAVLSTSETVWRSLLHRLLKKMSQFHLFSFPASCIMYPTTLPPPQPNKTKARKRCRQTHRESFCHLSDAFAYWWPPQTSYWFCKPINWKESVGSYGVTAQTDFHGYRLRSLSIPAILHSFIMQVSLPSPFLIAAHNLLTFEFVSITCSFLSPDKYNLNWKVGQ